MVGFRVLTGTARRLVFVPMSLALVGGLLALPARAEDLLDLLARHKIEVQVEGAGIQEVMIRIRQTARQAQRVEVTIPVGTFFAAANSESQSMVSVGESSVPVGGNWTTVTVPTACANEPRNIPSGDDRFAVRRLPQHGELAVAAKALDAAHAPYPVVQAAVWIITDNATFADMGTLVSEPGNARVIGEDDAARAMKILADAGIAIKRKAIWQQDRAMLAKAVPDKALATWLRSR